MKKKLIAIIIALITSGCTMTNINLFPIGQRVVSHTTSNVWGRNNTQNEQDLAAEKKIDSLLSGNKVDASKFKKETTEAPPSE